MGWGYTPPGGGGGGTTIHGDLTGRDDADQHAISAITGLEDALDGGVALFVDFRNLPNGPFTSTNGDGSEDPTAFQDVSAFAGGTAGLAAVRDGLFCIDPSLAADEASCRALIIQGDPILASVDSSLYTDAAAFHFNFAPTVIESATSDDDITTVMAWLLGDGDGDGWQFEIRSFNAADGTPSTQFGLYTTSGAAYTPDYLNPLYESAVKTGNLTAGTHSVVSYSDGRWEVWFLDTKVAEGGVGEVFDQQTAAVMGFRPDQRNLVADTPTPGFYIPVRWFAITQAGVRLGSVGSGYDRRVQMAYLLHEPAVSDTTVLDPTVARYHRVIMVESPTLIDLSNFPTDESAEMIVEFVGDETWSSGITIMWPDGTRPSYTTSATTSAIFRFWTFGGVDNGISGVPIYGELIGSGFYPVGS